MKDKKSTAVLSKKAGWIILAILVILDASLDLIFTGGAGLQSLVWKPISNFLKINNPLFLTPFVLIIFYFGIKGIAWLAKKVDKVSIKSEELVLTALVLVYGFFDFWLILVYFFNFSLFKSHYYLIPILIVIALIYSLWAEKKLKEY